MGSGVFCLLLTDYLAAQLNHVRTYGDICKPMQYDEGTMHQHRSGRRQRSMPDQFGEKTEVTCDAEIESSPNYLVSRSADITQGKVCQYEDDSEPHLSAYPERCVSGTALRDTIGIDGETDDGNTIPPVEIGSLSVSSLLGSAVTGADTTSRLSKKSISNSGLLIRCIVHGLDIMLTDGEGWQCPRVERQHKRVKRQVEPVKNTRQFEGTVLQRVLDDQVSSLQTFDVLKCNYGLSERRVWSMVNGHPASMADSIKWQGVAIHIDDLVVRDQSVGVVVACFELESDLLLDVEVMQHVESWKYKSTVTKELWRADEVRLAKAWRSHGGDVYSVLKG